MPKKIQKRVQSTRTQSQDDLQFVFDYQTGDVNQVEIDEEVQLTRELFYDYKSARELWAQKFQESVEFRAGAQWTNEERDVLEARGQAPIVVNRIHPIVETAKSLLTYNSPQFRSTGREDSDRETAKVFSDLFQYIWQISAGDEELKQAIDDYYVGGMGVLQVYQDPDADMGKGEVYIKSINPLDVYIDPNAKDVYARDAANILVTTYMTDEQAMQIYPEFTDIIEQSAMHPDESDDYPVTNLAATEGQLFTTDGTETVHNRRQYIERYSKQMDSYYNCYEPFSQQEHLLTEEEYEEYLKTYYVKVKTIKGEEIILFEEESVEDMFNIIETIGPMFHYEVPDLQMDEQGNPIPQKPVRVPGEEDENSIPGSTTLLIPMTVEELIGTKAIVSNQIEQCRVKMVVSVGDKKTL